MKRGIKERINEKVVEKVSCDSVIIMIRRVNENSIK